MPSKSKAQYKLFEIASYNKEFAEKRHMDQKVAREWHDEDKKKRKEDPEWYDNLPEKAEEKDDKDDKKKSDGKKGKAKKGDESMEGMLRDIVMGITNYFSAAKSKEVDSHDLYESPWNFVEQADKLVKETYTNKDWLAKAEVREGMVSNSDIFPLLRMSPWPSNVLDGIEKGVTELEKFLIAYSGAFKTYMAKIKPLYQECVKADSYVEAKEKFYTEQAKFSKPMDALKIPTGTLGNFSLRTDNKIFHSLVSTPVAGPALIPALTINGVEKAGKLMQRIFDILDDQYVRNDWWFPDVFADVKYAMRNDKFTSDAEEHALYDITKLADNSYDPINYYYDQIVIDQLVNAAKALDKLITRSVK